jgi:hypothetical protein
MLIGLSLIVRSPLPSLRDFCCVSRGGGAGELGANYKGHMSVVLFHFLVPWCSFTNIILPHAYTNNHFLRQRYCMTSHRVKPGS